MTWLPFRHRRPPEPSKEAKEAVADSTRELEEAKRLRIESQRVGQALRKAHEENHFAAALASVIAGRNTA